MPPHLFQPWQSILMMQDLSIPVTFNRLQSLSPRGTLAQIFNGIDYRNLQSLWYIGAAVL